MSAQASGPRTPTERHSVNGSDAAAYIRAMIATGVVKPGSRVPPERELAQQLGTSRGSVREAIRELTSQGILVARQGAGTYVTSLEDRNLFSSVEFAVAVDETALMNMYELRRILEPAAAALAASRCTEDEVGALLRACAKYVASARLGPAGVADLVDADFEIHDVIARSTRNPLIIGVLKGLRELAAYGRALTSSSVKTIPDGVSEVRSIVDAIAARDPLLAQSAMSTHIVRTEDRARTALASRAFDTDGDPDGDAS